MAIDYSQLDQARTASESAQKSALDYGARGMTLADELRKAIGERFGESPAVEQASNARADFLAQAPQARADVAGLVNEGSIMSPSQQQAILAAKRSAALVPLISANTIQEAGFGTLEDLIGAGTNAFSAQTASQQGLAELAQSNYSNLLSEIFKRAEEDRAAEMQKYDIDYKQALTRQAQASTTKTGKEADKGDVNSMANAALIADDTGKATVNWAWIVENVPANQQKAVRERAKQLVSEKNKVVKSETISDFLGKTKEFLGVQPSTSNWWSELWKNLSKPYGATNTLRL